MHSPDQQLDPCQAHVRIAEALLTQIRDGHKAENGEKGSKTEFSSTEKFKIDFLATFSFMSITNLKLDPRFT